MKIITEETIEINFNDAVECYIPKEGKWVKGQFYDILNDYWIDRTFGGLLQISELRIKRIKEERT